MRTSPQGLKPHNFSLNLRRDLSRALLQNGRLQGIFRSTVNFLKVEDVDFLKEN